MQSKTGERSQTATISSCLRCLPFCVACATRHPVVVVQHGGYKTYSCEGIQHDKEIHATAGSSICTCFLHHIGLDSKQRQLNTGTHGDLQWCMPTWVAIMALSKIASMRGTMLSKSVLHVIMLPSDTCSSRASNGGFCVEAVVAVGYTTCTLLGSTTVTCRQ